MAASNTIITNAKNQSALKWTLEGMQSIEHALLKVFDDGSFITQPNDPNHPEPYPQLFAASAQDDKGEAIYSKFLSEQVITKESMGANPWYTLDWEKSDDDVYDFKCKAQASYNLDNTIDAKYINGEGDIKTLEDIGTYVISDNKLIINISEDENMLTNTLSPVLVSSDNIIFENSAMFKNRDDAITFINTMSGKTDGGCASSVFPE
jgi:hypothetical protein